MESIQLLSSSPDVDEDVYHDFTPPDQRPLPKLIDYGFTLLKATYRTSLSLAPVQRKRKPRTRLLHKLCYEIPFYLAIAAICFILLSTINAILNPSFSNPPAHYEILQRRVSSSTVSGRGNKNNEKIYIAANIIDEKLIRGAWGQSLVELVDLLGEDNVFISIYENDSGVGTQNALLDLQKQFTCNSSVVTGQHLPLAGFPTVTLPNGEERVQRLTYLAEVRNRLLRPLDPTFALDQKPGFQSVADIKFSKILFLNDVYFSPVSAVQLLFSTNANMDNYDDTSTKYRTACAIDFVRAVMFYDSFVVRDSEGYGMGLMFYPWFTSSGRGQSRHDVRMEKDAVRVRSCWGGMAAFDASVFQHFEFEDASSKSLALSFRGSNEPFWEAAECCLIHADAAALYGPPNPENGTGVYINPYIRVAYTSTTWNWLPFFQRFERIFEYLQYIVSNIGYPEFNPRRTHEAGTMVQESVWSPNTRSVQHGHFTSVARRATPGGYCGQRRMFVMKKDLLDANTHGHGKNWEKVAIPPGS